MFHYTVPGEVVAAIATCSGRADGICTNEHLVADGPRLWKAERLLSGERRRIADVRSASSRMSAYDP